MTTSTTDGANTLPVGAIIGIVVGLVAGLAVLFAIIGEDSAVHMVLGIMLRPCATHLPLAEHTMSAHLYL